MAADQTQILSLPEDLISKIISLTCPKDACRAAAVSPAFKSAAESNIVWEQFLPPEYGEIFSPLKFFTKKELYFLLCDSHLFLRGSKMSIKLNKLNGKKAYTFGARELDIAWIDNPTHWRWTSLPESRFGEVAELLNVCWLDIRATLGSQILTPDTKYEAYLVFKLSEDHYGLQWVNGEITNTITKDAVLVSIAPLRFPRRIGLSCLRPRRRIASCREDGWMEVCLGEFFVQRGNDCDVKIQVCETENLHWKKGLIVEGIEVRPRELPHFLRIG